MVKSIVLVHAGEVEDGTETYGPFTSSRAAEQFADAYNEAAVRPAYWAEAVDLIPVREGRATIRDAMDDEGMRRGG